MLAPLKSYSRSIFLIKPSERVLSGSFSVIITSSGVPCGFIRNFSSETFAMPAGCHHSNRLTRVCKVPGTFFCKGGSPFSATGPTTQEAPRPDARYLANAHDFIRTENASVDGAQRFLLCPQQRHPAEMGVRTSKRCSSIGPWSAMWQRLCSSRRCVRCCCSRRPSSTPRGQTTFVTETRVKPWL